ncbi:MAG: peptidoglycan-N-acetylglucosamine deacetylase [Acidimicrobiaceae bacterium]|nr:peptidoglycan-N-acetylglucosamine deacetylase [Acidimicrobiaceae bacterium]
MTRRFRMSRFGVVGALVVVVALTLFTVVAVPPASSATWVVVDGRPVAVEGSAVTLGAALHAAHRVPRDGALLSAATHRVLDPHDSPATVLAGGRAVPMTAPLDVGDEVVVWDGADRVEPTVRRQIPVPPPGLPPVERVLWSPGQPGVAESEVGVVSGEPVGPSQVVTPPVPAALVPGNVVALTFDDGPSPVWTRQVLDILAQENVKATFCQVGYAIGWDLALARAAVEQGHAVCDHTAHHMEHLESKPHSQIVQEVCEGADDVFHADGLQPQWYRAPGGNLSPEVIDVAHQRGMRVLGWSVDPDDFAHPPAPVLLERILAKVGPGSIILLHDGGGDRSQTVAVLRPLIDSLRARGFTFTLPAS